MKSAKKRSDYIFVYQLGDNCRFQLRMTHVQDMQNHEMQELTYRCFVLNCQLELLKGGTILFIWMATNIDSIQNTHPVAAYKSEQIW